MFSHFIGKVGPREVKLLTNNHTAFNSTEPKHRCMLIHLINRNPFSQSGCKYEIQ